jgi:hypothetical protein
MPAAAGGAAECDSRRWLMTWQGRSAHIGGTATTGLCEHLGYPLMSGGSTRSKNPDIKFREARKVEDRCTRRRDQNI